MSTSDPRLKRIDRLGQLVRTLEGAVQVVSVVVPDADVLALNQTFRRVGGAVSALKLEAPDLNQRLDQLEEELINAERSLAEVDLCVPMDTFRPRVIEANVPPVFLVRYARLMGNRDLGVGIRRDRFEFVINRVLLHGQSKPPFRVTSKDKMLRLLFEIAPEPFFLAPEKLQQTVGSIEDAERRILALTSHDELFDSGVYMDLRGYKLTLRNELLNHDVLYAVARANVALANKIAEFTSQHPELETRIRSRLAEQTDEVNAVFAAPSWEAEVREIKKQAQLHREDNTARKKLHGTEREDTQSRVRAITGGEKKGEKRPDAKAGARSKEATPRAVVLDTDSDAPPPRGRRWVIVAGVVLLAAGAGAFFLLKKPTFQRLSPADVARISAHLESAEAAVQDGGNVIQAQLVASYRDELPGRQREIRDEVAAALQLQQYRTAFVRSGNTLVLQIVDGHHIDLGPGGLKLGSKGRGKRGVE
jgi:hypothetical protein